MDASGPIHVPDLQRFARLAAPLLRGSAARGLGPRAARDRPGPGLEFLDLRDYQPGDDIRHIDWRQSARRQRTVVRRFRDEAAADWFICVDGSASVKLVDDKWRMTVQLASALAYALLYAGHRVALVIFSERVDGFLPLGRGAHQFSALLALLLQQGRTQPGSKSNLGYCRDFLTHNSNVLVVSDFLVPDGMRTDLRSICATASSASALQVLASDEAQIPARGVARIQDVESGRHQSFLVTEQTAAGIRRNLAAHRDRLRTDCAALGIGFASCDAGDRWERVLLAHLHARG